MYVCFYERMCIYIYMSVMYVMKCNHVCMYVCTYVRRYVCIRMYVCMYVCMCLYVCLSVCLYVGKPSRRSPLQSAFYLLGKPSRRSPLQSAFYLLDFMLLFQIYNINKQFLSAIPFCFHVSWSKFNLVIVKEK